MHFFAHLKWYYYVKYVCIKKSLESGENMIDFNSLEENLIIICPNHIKESLVKLVSINYPNKHIKFMDKKEIICNKNFTFDYSALLYLSKKYGYSYAIAKEVLDNLTSCTINSEKLNILHDIYLDLKEHNLLKFNLLFKYLFKGKKTYIYGYSQSDIELQNALNELDVCYDFICDDRNQYTHNVYKYSVIDNEVKAFFINVMELVKNGKTLNDVYLYNLPADYKNIVLKYAKYHNIKIEGLNKTYLYDSPIYKKYLTYLNENSSIDAFNLLSEKIKNDPLNVLDKLTNIIVSINMLCKEKNEFLSLLNYIAKNTTLSQIKYDNSIKICDYNSIIDDNSYVFILGFSLDSFPTIYRDTDFYSDKEKEQLGKNTSKIKNNIEEEMLSNFILNTKNVIISYKEKQGKREYYPSLLIKKLGLNVIDGKINEFRYSSKLSELEVSKYLDMNRLYGIDNKYIKTYEEENIGYESYSHKFSGLNYENSDFIKLSATSIDEYNTCPFKYYANRVLKIGEFENTFALKLGNIFHLILQDSLTKEIILDDYKEVIEKEFNTYKEKVLLNNLLPQVLDVIEKNKEFYNNSHFKDAIAEKEITIALDENSVLTGKIDKVLLNNKDEELIVVDYKTSKFRYNKKKNPYGKDLQLPLYSFMLNNEYSNYSNVGMYIQNICLDRKELMDKDVTPYLLTGLTLKDDDAVKRIDNYLGDFDYNGNPIIKSQFIKSIKLKKDLTLDFWSGISLEEFDDLKDIAKEQVFKTLENIRKNNFDISPIKFKGDRDLPCKYCDYSDICFKKSSDERFVDLSGGEEDETV